MLADAEGIAAFVGPLARAAEPWRTLYSDSTLVSTTVLFLHLAALVASAGLAVATDRSVIRTPGADAATLLQRLDEMALSHRTVVFALVLSFVSGVLLLLADIEAFVVMLAFWIKMGLLALLIVNASLMLRHERRLRAAAAARVALPDPPLPPNTPSPDRSWARLRR